MRRFVGLAAMCGGAVAATALSAGAVGAQAADPPGNNGTVKVDGVEFDSHPDNEPHVGCVFEIDLYGYDEGDLDATVTFDAVAPTGDEELLTDDFAIGEDPAGGGTDLDAAEEYDLTEALASIEPHPVQGWHVKLTVHADGSQGADTKFKVFWVSGCGSTPPTTTPGSTTTTVPGSTTTVPPGSGSTTSTSTPDDDEPPTVPVPTPPAATPVAHVPDFIG